MPNIKYVITRYAPSPTGNLHIGGARTTVFNYLYAKKHHGTFILRIEDTDADRNVESGIDSQTNNLRWLNIYPDESFTNPGQHGPYLQSQKILRYQELAKQLLEAKKAYRCFCTPEELDAYRKHATENGITPRYSRKCRDLTDEEITAKLAANTPFAIRLKLDDATEYAWNDLLRGPISFPGTALGDYVILRSSKIPTYNFAVVVDDYDMKISHVLRGEEHIANTPYQLATYQALGWANEIPAFCHLSVIVNESGKKLSKRDETIEQFIEQFKDKGYLPEAVFNFLAFLGWSGETTKEIMTQQELINEFSLEKLSKAPSFFDVKKLNWMSGEYFKKMEKQSYWNFVNSFFDIDLGELNSKKEEIAYMFQNQIHYAKALNELAYDLFYTQDKVTDMVKINRPTLLENIDVLKTALELFPTSSDDWEYSAVRAFLKQIMAKTGKKGADFFMPLRLAISFKNHGPELFKVIHLLGYNTCLARLKETLQLLVVA